MAKGYIIEMTNLPDDEKGQVVPVLPNLDHCVVQAPVTFTTTAQSAATVATTRFVDIVANAACHIEVGTNPSATANSAYIPAGSRLQIEITPGHKVAFYDGAS